MSPGGAARLVEVGNGVDGPRRLSFIVPTRNEADNMAVLLQRLDGALRLLDAEIIFVDDSDDDTRQQILRLGATSGCPVRVVHRPPGQRVGGLSGAVVVGLRTAQASWAVVMDADLQHPPEVVPRLLDAAGPDVDLVVATRYADEGEPAGLDGPVRRLVSLTCTVLARTLVPSAAAGHQRRDERLLGLRPQALAVDPVRKPALVRLYRTQVGGLFPTGDLPTCPEVYWVAARAVPSLSAHSSTRR